MADERTPVQQEIDASLDPERLAVHQANRAIHAPSPAAVPDPRFRDKLAPLILVARCTNVLEPDGRDCSGRLRYSWGQTEAACNTCGGRCGIAVALWLQVEPIAAEVQAQVQAAANQRAAEELETFASKWARWVVEGAPQTRGGAAYRARAEASALRAALAQPAQAEDAER